jgi:hypothetical protein
MDGGKGFLFVAQENIDPFTIEYKQALDDIETIRIYILMRDFDGVNDNLANDEETSTLTKEHLYNLRNQGWVPPGSPSVQGSVPGDGVPTEPGVGGGGGGVGFGGGDSGGTGGSSGEYYNAWTGGLARRGRVLD